MELRVTIEVDGSVHELLKNVPDEVPTYVKMVQLRNMTFDVLEHVHMGEKF